MKAQRVTIPLLTRWDLYKMKDVMYKYKEVDYVRFEDDTTEEEFKASPLYEAVIKICNLKGFIIYNV